MPWQVTTFLYVLFSSLRAIQNRRIGLYKRDVSAYALVTSFVSIFIVGLGAALLNWDRIDHNAALEVAPFLIFGGLLFAGLNIAILKLYRFVPASVMAFTALLNTLSIVFFATVFGGESLTSQQLLGAAILFASVIVVGLFTKRKKSVENKIFLGIVIVTLSALAIGIAIMNEKYLIQTIGIHTYLLYGWGLQMLSALIIAYSMRDKTVAHKRLTKNIHINVWLVGILLALSGFMYVSSINSTRNVAPIALSGTAVVGLTVFMAYFWLQEKDHLHVKLIGLFLSGLGLLLLFS